MRKVFFVGSVLCASVDANQLRIANPNGGNHGNGNGGVIRQELRNEDDVQYSGKVKVGGQEIDVVPDTGSFELVFFSDECNNCGTQKRLLHEKRSKTFKEGHLEAEQNYGSGSTESKEAYDDVEVGSSKSQGQMFWEVYDANMPLLQDASFQGIFGLGPPSSNPKMAQKDAEQVKEEVNEMKKAGQDVSEYTPIVKQYEDIAKFSHESKMWLKNMNIQHFSVCLQKENGAPGVFIYNDDTNLDMFSKKLDLRGDILYWSVKLDSAWLGSDEGGTELKLVEQGHGADMVLDTGTSLVAVPQDVLDKVLEAMDKFTKKTDGCSDLSKLPDLKFVMGGEHFSLPPEAYMGEVDEDDQWPDWAMEAMPHLKPIHEEYMQKRASLGPDQKKTRGGVCTPLLMSLGEENMWILGMPFFRKYYTRFGLSNDSMDGRTVHFAEFGKNCEIRKPSDLLLGASEETRGIPKRITAKKLLPPRHLRNKALLKSQ